MPTPPVDATPALDEAEVRMLNLMFETNGEYNSYQLSQELQLSIGHTEHYISQLLKLELLDNFYAAMSDPYYKISSGGRSYIISNG